MITHSDGWLVSDGAKVNVCPNPPLLAVWCVHASVFHIQVEYEPSRINGWWAFLKKELSNFELYTSDI